ncbi:hypothetical protein AK812_SmicGene36921, partial [Symbiodinium microadriaticum]
STFSHTIRSFARTADEQPLVNRDTTKCTGSVESLDWFNTFFARLWPKIAAYVQKLMEDVEGNVTQRMQAALPSMLKGVRGNKKSLWLGGLVISFLNPPKLAMEYKFLASLVGNSTLEPTVKSAIDRALAKALVMPNVISIPIGSEEKGVDRALLRSPRPYLEPC